MESFFEACENGKISEAKTLLSQLDQSSLEGKKTPDGRTCFHMAVISGDAGLVDQLAATLRGYGLSNIIRMTDEKGDTALHLAVREDRVGIAKQLVDLDTSFCECANKRGETPLKLAASLGFREAVEFLVTRTSNALHYIVELNQVKLVKYLIKMLGKEDKLKLSKLINEHYEPAPNPPDQENSATNSTNPSDKENSSTKPTNPPDNEGNRAANPQNIQPIDKVQQDPEEKSPTNSTATDAKDDQPIVRRGDTPLQIAARNKYGDMVNLLLKVDGVNRRARNSEGKTPFEIAREVTEYHESFRMIRKLGYYSRRTKPFMYCAPQVSREKYKNARFMVNKAYEDRRNAELVVAALLAAMTCAAAFTVPGGFNSESPVKDKGGSPIAYSPAPSPSNVEDDLGTPLLISLVSFKLFIIFDCIAFFLALFVCIMWEMSCELTTGDKMLFMTVNSLVVCCSFGFTAYGFMAAVYAMLARKVRTFSWVVLGTLIGITACGVLAFIRQSIHFAVTRARFHRLCGVSCFVDEIVEKVWCGAERCGLLNLVRSGDDVSRDFISGIATVKSDDDKTNNSQSSPSCCCNHV